MGIRFSCPNGHKLNVKTFLAGKRGVCPQCGAKFVIPIQADSPESEILHPMEVGQSHSVEIVPPMPIQTASATASPSIIIAVSEIDAPVPELKLEPAVNPTPTVSPVVTPPISDVVAEQPLIVTEAAAVIPEPAFLLRRERNRRKQLTISVVLLLLVIVLAVVLIWVLKRDAGGTTGEKASAAKAMGSRTTFGMALL